MAVIKVSMIGIGCNHMASKVISLAIVLLAMVLLPGTVRSLSSKLCASSFDSCC